MPRLLFVAVSALAGILPVSVFALGLGEISLKSALNQPFYAEIPLTSESTDDVSQLKVSLASGETFERFGLLRPGFLSDFEFRVVTERGRTVIRATSTNPVVEPFVTLLLEINWPQGRLLREYTVLLDPPVYDSGAAVAAAPQPQPASPVAAPTRQEPAPASTTAPVARPSRPAPTATGGNYGPVQRNDTLWAIAERVRPDASIDMNQMMLAIYRANPEAFAGNINRLRAGAILRLPDASELDSLSRRDAFAEVRRQNDEWRGSTPTRAADSARLRLVPPSDTGEAAGGEQQAMVPPGAAADTAGMQAQIADLQAQLADRDRLLELRSQELQDLQNQLETLRAREAELTGEAPVAEPLPAPVPEPAPVAETPTPAPAPAPDVAPEPTPPAATGMPPAVTTTVRDEPSMMSQLLSGNWLYIIIGVAAALLLSLFVVRGRRKAAPVGEWGDLLDEGAEAEKVADTAQIPPPRAADETFVVEETPPAADTDQLAGSPAATMEMDRTGDQEAPLEKTLSSDAALNLDQADPIAEAEFHMAYGLYDQAADLLQDALKDEPERRDLRRKLIDVYFVWENRGGFLRESQAFREQVGDQDAEWNKVLIMGKQLCPEEELFAAAPATVSADEAMDLALDEELGGDVDLQLGDEDAGVDLELSAIRAGPDAEGLDFDLGDASAEDADLSPTAQWDEESPTIESPTVEAEGPASPTVETPTIEAAGPASPTVETPTIESPMAEPTMETPTIETPAAMGLGETVGESGDETAALDLDELGLDLDDFADIGDDAEADETAEQPADVISDDDATLLAGDAAAEPLLQEMRTGLDSTAEVEKLDIDFGEDEQLPGEGGLESTGEMKAIEADADDDTSLEALTQALEKSAVGPGGDIADTVEQPKSPIEDTAEQPGPGTGGDADATAQILPAGPDLGRVDLELDEELAAEDSPTGTMDSPQGGRREGPTMTEVGTKLDLARAYLDMGDPDGARSILDEVVEEGDDAQRQEAQQLLDQLPR